MIVANTGGATGAALSSNIITYLREEYVSRIVNAVTVLPKKNYKVSKNKKTQDSTLI